MSYQAINAPRVGAGRVSIRGDLKPAAADSSVCQRVADFLHIRHYGAFVAGVDDVGGIAGQGMSPCELGGRASGDGDDCGAGGGWVWAAVAGNVVGGYVRDGLWRL